MTDDIVVFIRERLQEDAAIAHVAMRELEEREPGTQKAGEWSSGNIYMSDDGTPTGYDVWADDDPDSTVLRMFPPDRPVALQALKSLASEWSTHEAFRTEWTP